MTGGSLAMYREKRGRPVGLEEEDRTIHSYDVSPDSRRTGVSLLLLLLLADVDDKRY